MRGAKQKGRELLPGLSLRATSDLTEPERFSQVGDKLL
jgi:hypothetical protein